MPERIEPEEVLLKYYDAICSRCPAGISRYFDETVTLISLTGSSAISGAENIDAVFETLIETWDNLGVSLKIEYDPGEFRIEEIQPNVALIRTRITNRRITGELFESWNCMYVLVNTEAGWKISLATFDDKGTQEFAGAS
jgi:hypothetical protein